MTVASDVLPAFFLADDPDEVLAAAVAVTTLSSGRLHHADGINRRTGKPERFGLFCARTFGPTEDDRCLCGKYATPAERGRVCEKCGVLCGSPGVRGERWAHLESAVGLVHPRLAPQIARQLGCSVADLRRVVACEADLLPRGGVGPRDHDVDRTGLEHLAERLGERADATLCRHVPVTPAAWRGTRRDPQDIHYAALINRCNRLARLLELSAPRIIVHNEQRLAQDAFDRLYAAVRAELSARGPLVVATTTPQARALLQAVYDDPGSDAPRRAYATHLRDAGDLRGEFILSQLANARRARPTAREADLLRRDFERYLAPLHGFIDPGAVFRRGFVASCKTVGVHARVDDPAWATVEHLETDLPDLVRSPALRALVGLAVPASVLVAVHAAGAVLPRVHTLQLTISHCPPPQAAALRTCDVLPGLRDLTVVHKSTRGSADWRWLADCPLARDLERLTLVQAQGRLPRVDLPGWLAFMHARPHLEQVTLTLGKHLLSLELRRDREWHRLRVVVARTLVETIAMSSGELADQLVDALTALGPHDVMAPRVECSGNWFGESLASAAARLRDHFGPDIVLPRLA